MKVRELIEELKKHDPEMEVVRMDDDRFYRVSSVDLQHDVLVNPTFSNEAEATLATAVELD